MSISFNDAQALVLKFSGNKSAAAVAAGVPRTTFRAALNRGPAGREPVVDSSVIVAELRSQLSLERARVNALVNAGGPVRVVSERKEVLRFAVIGDTHFGSLYFSSKALSAFYEYAAGRGVDTFLHAGDVLAGHGIFKGQVFELQDVGVASQIARLQAVAPRIGRTLFITGNHDASFTNCAGVPVGQMISQARSDWEFLGDDHARIAFNTKDGPYSVDLVHPGGGSAFSLSYKLQKSIDALPGADRPDMLVSGHLHKSLFLPSYQSVAGVLCGTFEKQSPFMARNNLSAHVGGWVFEVIIGGGWKVLRSEFVSFDN